MATTNKFGTSSLYDTIQEVIDENNDESPTDAGGSTITNLGEPVYDSDAATKVYVDTNDELRLSKIRWINEWPN